MGDLAHHFEYFFVRFRTGIHIVNAAHAWHFFDQFLGELRTRDGPHALGEIVHFNQLITHSICDLCAAIANIHSPDTAGDSIQEFTTGLVPDTDAFAFHDDARVIGFQRLVLGQVVPDMGAIGLNDVGQVIHGVNSLRAVALVCRANLVALHSCKS